LEREMRVVEMLAGALGDALRMFGCASPEEFMRQYRFVLVVALLVIASALAMERGRLPLALRGIRKMMGRDAGECAARGERRGGVSARRRALAFALVVAAFLAVVL
jgi:hypothetical protein